MCNNPPPIRKQTCVGASLNLVWARLSRPITWICHCIIWDLFQCDRGHLLARMGHRPVGQAFSPPRPDFTQPLRRRQPRMNDTGRRGSGVEAAVPAAKCRQSHPYRGSRPGIRTFPGNSGPSRKSRAGLISCGAWRLGQPPPHPEAVEGSQSFGVFMTCWKPLCQAATWRYTENRPANARPFAPSCRSSARS